MGWRALGSVFVRALPPLALPGILLGIIYSGIATPTEAASIAASYALVLALGVYRSLTLAKLYQAITETVRQTAAIGLIMSGAFVFNYAVANEGVPDLIRAHLIAWHLSPMAFLLAVDVLLLVMAIAIDEITILLVVVPVLVPVAQGLGIDLVHFGIVIMLNMMVGLALPPHGLLLFVISGLTATPIGAVFREIPVFIGTMIVVLLAVTLVPELALMLPRAFGYKG
jgi:tripartite ATP-independent transporter DctM subunit